MDEGEGKKLPYHRLGKKRRGYLLVEGKGGPPYQSPGTGERVSFKRGGGCLALPEKRFSGVSRGGKSFSYQKKGRDKYFSGGWKKERADTIRGMEKKKRTFGTIMGGKEYQGEE